MLQGYRAIGRAFPRLFSQSLRTIASFPVNPIKSDASRNSSASSWQQCYFSSVPTEERFSSTKHEMDKYTFRAKSPDEFLTSLLRSKGFFDKDAASLQVTDQFWNEIYLEFVENNPKEKFIFDSCLMRIIQRGEQAMLLMRFLEGINFTIHISTFCYYIELLGTLPFSAAAEEEILKYFKKIEPHSMSLSVDLCRSVTLGLARTRLWPQCLRFLAQMKQQSIDSTSIGLKRDAICAVIEAALGSGEYATAYGLIDVLGVYNFEPTDAIYDAFIRAWDKFQDGDLEHRFERLLNVIGKYYFYPPESVVNRILTWISTHSSFKWRSSPTSLSTDGVCKVTKVPLAKVKIGADEFNQLKKSILDRVLIGGDVFIHTRPEELKFFRHFLEKYSPFDVVIDGLNVWYMSNQHERNLDTVLHKFLREQKKVLLIGRKHLFRDYRHPRNPSLYTFSTDDYSSDDPFMLYAALYSGPATHIVSSDRLRDSKFLTGPEMKNIFFRWQTSRTFLPQIINRRLELVPPRVYETKTQKNGGVWHIPCDNMEHRFSYELPDTWYCLHKVE